MMPSSIWQSDVTDPVVNGRVPGTWFWSERTTEVLASDDAAAGPIDQPRNRFEVELQSSSHLCSESIQ
jgi:hypothetical protein